MLIKSLYLVSLGSVWKLLLGAFLILLMYISIIIGMFDPENVEAMRSMVEALPESLSAAFGYDVVATNLTSHIGAYMYGFLMLIFPLIYIIPAANNMIAGHVDKGSMAYILATPNSRKSVAFTQAFYLFTTTLLLFIAVTLSGLLFAGLLFPGLLRTGDYLLLNLVTLSVHLVLAGIAFLASCIFSETRHSLTLGLGIPLVFLLFKIMSGVNEDLEVVRYLTLFSLIDVTRIFADSAYAFITSGILAAVSLLLFAAGIYVFDRRSLNI